MDQEKLDKQIEEIKYNLKNQRVSFNELLWDDSLSDTTRESIYKLRSELKDILSKLDSKTFRVLSQRELDLKKKQYSMKLNSK